MTTKHTPGPWTYTEAFGSGSNVHSLLVTHPAAFAIEDRGNAIALAVFPVNANGKEVEANARLLAAAPEMLEALKTANAAINPSDRSGISLCAWNDRLKAATLAIHAAIAKAEGRS